MCAAPAPDSDKAAGAGGHAPVRPGGGTYPVRPGASTQRPEEPAPPPPVRQPRGIPHYAASRTSPGGIIGIALGACALILVVLLFLAFADYLPELGPESDAGMSRQSEPFADPGFDPE